MDDFCYLAHATGQGLLSVQERMPQVHMGLTLPQVVTGNPQQNRQVPPSHHTHGMGHFCREMNFIFDHLNKQN